jgi:hypothetical protein
MAGWVLIEQESPSQGRRWSGKWAYEIESQISDSSEEAEKCLSLYLDEYGIWHVSFHGADATPSQ